MTSSSIMSSTLQKRALKDLSARFTLPTVPQTVPMADQPPLLRMPLFEYQRRSLYRMAEIEENGEICPSELGLITQKELHSLGGVVCDTVGMGKTAQLIALMASRGSSSVKSDTPLQLPSGHYVGRANLVITPSHLCTQWKEEIRKFVGHDLKVIMATDLSQHMKVKFKDLLQADIVITSMEYITSKLYAQLRMKGSSASKFCALCRPAICSTTWHQHKWPAVDKLVYEQDGAMFAGGAPTSNKNSAKTASPIPLPEHWRKGDPDALQCFHKIKFRRVILDECHEAIHLDNEKHMDVFQGLEAENVWCVTGTPFPNGDRSMYGIHQILGIRLKLHISNDIFAVNKALSKSHPFEKLKRRLYLRNTPESVGDEWKSATDGGIKCISNTVRLRFTGVERGFYNEQERRVLLKLADPSIKDPYAPRCLMLRQLCCHPAVSEEWQRLLSAYQGVGEGAVLTLENLRGKMVTHKERGLVKLREQIEKIEYEICAATNSIHLVRQTMNQGASMRSLVQILDWAGAPENRSVEAPEGSEGGEENQEAEAASKEAVESRKEGSNEGTEEPSKGFNLDLHEDPAVLEEKDREYARQLMREENAAARQELGKRKRDVSSPGRPSRRRRGEEKAGNGGGVPFRVTVQTEGEDGRKFIRAFVEERRRDVEDWLESELMENDEKRAAFLKSADEFIVGAQQTRGQKLAEIPAVQGELKYFHDLIEELEKQDTEANRECLVCGAENLSLVSMTPCGHWYCSPCLTSWLEGHRTCPTCRQGVGADDVMHINLELQGFDAGSGLVKRFGTKPAALCAFIQGVMDKEKDNPKDKEPARFIVFSQWHPMLQLVARTLLDNGIKNVSCSGDQRQRDAALASFRNGSVRVLMLSLEYAASGTNLQCANHVILLEPAGRNPGHGMDTEAQAIGRAARLGQKRLVTVTRFIMEGTVEEDIHRRNDEARARAQAAALGGEEKPFLKAKRASADARKEEETVLQPVTEKETVQGVGIGFEANGDKAGDEAATARVDAAMIAGGAADGEKKEGGAIDGSNTAPDNLTAEIVSPPSGPQGPSSQSRSITARAELTDSRVMSNRGLEDRGVGPSQASTVVQEDERVASRDLLETFVEPPRMDTGNLVDSQTESTVLHEVLPSQDENKPLEGNVTAGRRISEDRRVALESGQGAANSQASEDPVLEAMEVEESETNVCPLGCGTIFAKGATNLEINEHVDMCLNQETLTQITGAGAYE